MVYGLIASSCDLLSTNLLLYLGEDEMISMNMLLEYNRSRFNETKPEYFSTQLYRLHFFSQEKTG